MNLMDFRRVVSKWLAVCLSVFTIVAVSTLFLDHMVNLAIFLGLTLSLAFIQKPFLEEDNLWSLGADLLFSVLSLLISAYIWWEYMALIFRAGNPTALDIWVSILGTLLVLEAARRTVGWALVSICILFIAYAFFGQHLFHPISHGGYDLQRIVGVLFLSENGILGVPLSVMFNFIYLFIAFGALFSISGGTEFFIDTARSLFGKMTGGPAKIAVVTSAMMGTLSGSAVANTVTTGTFTIPLMKKLRFEPHIAGAVEAASSSGGALMPPIMGAAAFIMADFLNVPYFHIVKAALIPAIIYYVAIFAIVHFYSLKIGGQGEIGSNLPSIKEVFRKGWIFIPPFFVLIYFLAIGHSPSRSILYSLLVLYVMSSLRADTRMGPRKIVQALTQAGMHSLNVSGACASAGIVVGIVLLTGLGVKIGSLVLEFSGGHLFLALPFIMVASIILGMGLPSVVCYILLAVTVAPPLIKLGVDPPLAAHMFIYYFGMMSMVTPPVGFAAYAAAAIAGSDAMKTAFAAWRFALAGFLLPYMFIYNPSLLMFGTPLQIGFAVATAVLGVLCLSSSIVGFVRKQMTSVERLAGLAAAVLLIKPGWVTDAAGIILAALILLLQSTPLPRKKPMKTGYPLGEMKGAHHVGRKDR